MRSASEFADPVSWAVAIAEKRIQAIETTTTLGNHDETRSRSGRDCGKFILKELSIAIRESIH
jgi:hypothetical protein